MSEKKKHKGESIIGKIIYATLLFMPLMSIFVRSMYVVCNKNAYQSYDAVTDTTTYNVTNLDQLIVSKQYSLTSGLDSNTNISTCYYFTEITAEGFTLPTDINYNGILVYGSNTQYKYHYYYNETKVSEGEWLVNKNTTITFKYQSHTSRVSTYNFIGGKMQGYYEKFITLDNVFEYSIDKVEQNSMYNWTTSTGTYDVINRTTTGLGIQNSFVDLLLTYWILLTIIYIIYDIGLCLVMMAHRKVHSLIDSVD